VFASGHIAVTRIRNSQFNLYVQDEIRTLLKFWIYKMRSLQHFALGKESRRLVQCPEVPVQTLQSNRSFVETL